MSSTSIAESLLRPDLHKVHDSTKIKSFMECPRRYFFEYVLHWRKGGNKHLEFGSAWHLAKEALYLGKSLEEAYALFIEHYRQHFPASLDGEMRPKDPATAYAALESWLAANKPWLRSIEVLHTEVGGTTPLFDDNVLTWKMDVVAKDSRGVWAIDHKTSSILSNAWIAGWELDPQMKLYINALTSIYGEGEVAGAIVDGSILQKSGVKHQQVKVLHTERQMNNWFWNINYYLHMLEYNFDELSHCSLEDEVLMAFPQNPQSCQKWGMCPYHSYCAAWSNPASHDCPSEFTVNPWNPLDHTTKKEGDL